jgi:hypothetical protein
MVGTLSTSQFVSVLIVPLAIVMLFWLGKGTGPEAVEARRARAA